MEIFGSDIGLESRRSLYIEQSLMRLTNSSNWSSLCCRLRSGSSSKVSSSLSNITPSHRLVGVSDHILLQNIEIKYNIQEITIKNIMLINNNIDTIK